MQPYDIDSWCVKCGSTGASTKYVGSMDVVLTIDIAAGETTTDFGLLRRTCPTCGYEWCETPLDADIDVTPSDIEEDAARFRWLLNGNGYFMEENDLCGYEPCTQEEQDKARAVIDEARLRYD